MFDKRIPGYNNVGDNVMFMILTGLIGKITMLTTFFVMLVTFTKVKIGQLHLKSVAGISCHQQKMLQISVTNINVRILIFNLM